MPRRPLGDKAMTDAERQRKRRARLAREQEPKLSDRQKTRQEIDILRQRIRGFEAELAHERQQTALATAEITELKAELARAAAGKPREAAAATTAPPTEAERTIKRLRDRNWEANAEIRHLRRWSKTTGLPEKGGMSLATYRKITKVLHPDRQPGETERGEAIRAFNVWVDSLKPNQAG